MIFPSHTSALLTSVLLLTPPPPGVLLFRASQNDKFLRTGIRAEGGSEALPTAIQTEDRAVVNSAACPRGNEDRESAAELAIETAFAPPVKTCRRPQLFGLPECSIVPPENGQRNRPHGESGMVLLLPPERDFKRSPVGHGQEYVRGKRGVCSRGEGKPDQPDISLLRAPGWGRDTAITSIPPALWAAGKREGAASSAVASPRVGAATTAVIPRDLLTPVTEAATVDERSVVSCGTRGTTRMTPASSAASASRPEQRLAPSVTRGSARRRSPCAARVAHHHKPADVPGASRHASPGGSGDGGGRSIRRRERATWGNGSVSGVANGGALSAPGGGSSAVRSNRRRYAASESPSSSAYRSPLSAVGDDRVGARVSSFSSGSGGRRVGEARVGYAAAMGRRARSMARCEAARRLAAAARASKMGRPSTPISERARWGKGRETRVEVERRVLLQRKAEYAKELNKKSKV